VRQVLGIAVALGVLATPGAASACGVERWDVKTLSDSRAGLVKRHATTTVDRLRTLTPPSVLGPRVAPVETTIYTRHGSWR